jgi:hypothetical protein
VSLVIPASDLWMRVLGRHQVDVGLVHQVGQLIRERLVVVPGLVRLALLGQCRDGRQFSRVQAALLAFPDPLARGADYVEAARLVQELRPRLALANEQALVWTLAKRIGARIWSQDRGWLTLRAHGCPLVQAETALSV